MSSGMFHELLYNIMYYMPCLLKGRSCMDAVNVDLDLNLA